MVGVSSKFVTGTLWHWQVIGLLIQYKVYKIDQGNLHLIEEISFPMPAVERLNKTARTKHVVRTFASYRISNQHLLAAKN